MSTTDDVITRRTVFVTVAGAACMLLVPPGKADAELPLRGPYRIERWGKTWLNPSKDRVLARVPAIAMPDIAGYWPQTTRPVRGPQEYAKRIIDLLDFIPDFRAEPTRDERGRHVRSLDRQRHGPERAVRSGRRGSTDRSQRLRCGEPYPFGSSDLRGFRKICGRCPRRLAIGRSAIRAPTTRGFRGATASAVRASGSRGRHRRSCARDRLPRGRPRRSG